jgi:hypothetical protein
MTDAGDQPKASLYGAIRFFTVFGTLAILVCLALYLVSLAFQSGFHPGIRSLAGILLPILAGSFVFLLNRPSLSRLRALPTAASFSMSLAAGALLMAALRFLVGLTPVPITELLIASCISVLVFASDSLPKLAFGETEFSADRALSFYYGVVSGMLLYVVLFGFPRIGAG